MPKQKYKQRKDGRYATTFHGKPVYANTSKELENKIIELNYLYKTGAIVDEKKITFKDYSEKWLKLQKEIYPEKSHERSTRLLNNHINPQIGIIQLTSLKKSNILQLQAEMTKKNLTESTNRALALVKVILQSAIDDNLITKNVAINIKGKTYDKEERKPLTEEEDFLLLETAKTNKYGLFFLFMRYCGLRPEEARALTISDINIKKQTINIDKALSYSKSEQGMLKDTKNNVHREVPILDFMLPYIETKIEECRKQHTSLLFHKQNNSKEYMSKSSYNSVVKSFMYSLNKLNKNLQKDNKKDILDIKFIPYQLRHSYCTMLYYSGIGIKEAQDLMGDKNSKMILDIYTHLQRNNEDLLNKLNLFYDVRSQKIVKVKNQ